MKEIFSSKSSEGVAQGQIQKTGSQCSLYQKKSLTLHLGSRSLACRWLLMGAGGKSGQRRASHFLTGSCWRQWVSAEENNRPPSWRVRVRRWCKRPPAGGWSSGCAHWELQVRVYHRRRAARPNRMIRWRVERWRHGVTHVVDKWQAMISSSQNPAYKGSASFFHIIFWI